MMKGEDYRHNPQLAVSADSNYDSHNHGEEYSIHGNFRCAEGGSDWALPRGTCFIINLENES